MYNNLQISLFSVLAGKYSPILIQFLQLNMCQELQIFAVVCMYVGAGYVLLDSVIVTLELLP